jgi:hypothetical protein
LRKKNKEEVEGETARDKYITHTESSSIQLKNPTQKGRGGEGKTHTHNLLVKVLMQKSLRAFSREIYESF